VIDESASLHPLEFAKRPVYVALGDSITHGSAGLGGVSELSYPFRLGKLLGFDTYNLGVGGSRVSPPIGAMLSDWERIDLITLLIGYNDFSWAGVPVEAYRASYIQLLKSVRKTHPSVPLYCITLTYTRTEKSQKTGELPETYRQVVRDEVKKFQDRGDDKIFLLEGTRLTDAEDLIHTVHLTAEGNQRFAEKLYRAILKNRE